MKSDFYNCYSREGCMCTSIRTLGYVLGYFLTVPLQLSTPFCEDVNYVPSLDISIYYYVGGHDF